MAIEIKNNSPLRFGTFVLSDAVEFWDVLELPPVQEQTDDIRYIVVANDRLDTLAHRFYADVRLWWVIAVANDIELVPLGFDPGVEIRIPSPRYVTQVLLNKAAGGRLG